MIKDSRVSFRMGVVEKRALFQGLGHSVNRCLLLRRLVLHLVRHLDQSSHVLVSLIHGLTSVLDHHLCTIKCSVDRAGLPEIGMAGRRVNVEVVGQLPTPIFFPHNSIHTRAV